MTTTTINNDTMLDQPYNAAFKFLLISAIFGAIMGVVFIMIQPLFGLDTLTSRHAESYQKLGDLNATPAIIIAWLAHSAVSIFYGILSGLVMLKTSRIAVISGFALLFTWITTVIAPPANAIIVQTVSFGHLKVEQLPPLNFSFDAKFWLHLIFFAAISIALYIYKKKS